MNKVKLDLDHVVCCVSSARYTSVIDLGSETDVLSTNSSFTLLDLLFFPNNE
jgi:hypothetical protein